MTLHPQPIILLTACCLWLGVAPLHGQAEAPLQLLLCPLLTRCRLPYRMLWLLSCSAPSSFNCCSVQLQAFPPTAAGKAGSPCIWLSLSSHVPLCCCRQGWLLIPETTACLRTLPLAAAAGNASSWLIFQVSQHPKVAAKIRQELADLGLLATPERPQPRRLEWADLAKLQYLNCCIKVSHAAHCCTLCCSHAKHCPIAAMQGWGCSSPSAATRGEDCNAASLL